MTCARCAAPAAGLVVELDDGNAAGPVAGAMGFEIPGEILAEAT